MNRNHPFNNSMLCLLLQVLLLIVQRHVVDVLADNHSFKWEGLHPVQVLNDHEQQQNRQRRRRRTGGIKGGRQLNATGTTTTTTTTTTTGAAHTPTFAQTAHKAQSNDIKSKNKLKKQQSGDHMEEAEGERWCGWGRKNVVVHTVYDSRNIEEAKPNEYVSGLGFPFEVVALFSSDDNDDDMLYENGGAAIHSLNGGHWTQTVLAISENIRIGHDELTFYQNTGNDNDNNNNITDVMQGHDMSSSNINKDQSVAGVLTTQFDSTLNVAIVTAGSGMFECAQGNPQVAFQEGSTVVTIVWDLCVCETATIPEEEDEYVEEDDDDLDHDEEPQEEETEQEQDDRDALEPELDRNVTAAAAHAAPAAEETGGRKKR